MATAPTVSAGPMGSKNDPFYNSIRGGVNVTPNDPLADPSRYKVNVPKTMERIYQPLYSYQLYPAAGASVLTFFQNPAGSGGLTRQDTNMELAGQLPAPQMFMIQGIAVDFLQGTEADFLPMTAARADSNIGSLNDYLKIMRKGILDLTIGSKKYATMQPLPAVPPRSHFNAATALASSTTPAAALQVTVQVPFSDGDVMLPIPLLLESGQNFAVTLSWPDGVLTTTSATARIGVVLYGTLYRPAQ